MLISYTNGAGNVILRLKVRSTTSPYGGFTGLTNSSSGLRIATIADNEATATVYTTASSNVETITTLGTYAAPTSGKCRLKEVDATNHPGVIEIQLADARYGVVSAKSLLVTVSGVSGMAECDVLVPLTAVNPYNGVTGGMSALPSASPASSGGLPVVGIGVSGNINCLSGGRVSVGAINTDVITAASIAADASTEIATAVLTSQMTESYAADGVAPTLAQAIFLIQQALTEFAISGTAMTVKKLDGSTTAAGLTLDSSSSPTSVTRTS